MAFHLWYWKNNMSLSQPLGRPFVFGFVKLRKASEPDLPANQPRFSGRIARVFFFYGVKKEWVAKFPAIGILGSDLSTKNLCSMEVRRRRSEAAWNILDSTTLFFSRYPIRRSPCRFAVPWKNMRSWLRGAKKLHKLRARLCFSAGGPGQKGLWHQACFFAMKKPGVPYFLLNPGCWMTKSLYWLIIIST